MQRVRQADRVETNFAVVMHDRFEKYKFLGTEFSANGILLRGTAAIEGLDSDEPREIQIFLPGGIDVQAWAQQVRMVGEDVAFRLLGLTEAGKQALLAAVAMEAKRSATLH